MNIETYHGTEAVAMFANLPSYSAGNATYRTSDGYAHWLYVNALTAVKYDFFYKIENKDDITSNMKNGTMKITRSCNVEKEMAAITMLQLKAHESGEKIFPLIDNINKLTE